MARNTPLATNTPLQRPILGRVRKRVDAKKTLAIIENNIPFAIPVASPTPSRTPARTVVVPARMGAPASTPP
ncbi:hypothetical protein AKJ35_01475 [candidate division MSBL1 archaeon SCGC-AAA833F18]|uniref:Uncharacterized protein n=1 Tax=candidate division MSBL1 archaeon SCGC-AAA833F18 TaxID=1698257 RepID=A0A133VRJ6_9EURY|nr:hypothetical protein AKJ35_01475 [candidate division MSBL1 archaeon SCGC-AAA833F18]